MKPRYQKRNLQYELIILTIYFNYYIIISFQKVIINSVINSS